MRSRIKRIIPIVALLLLCTTLLTGMSGCVENSIERYYFDTELFRCVSYSKDSKTTAIIGLTEKGREQELLVFPEELNGYRVDQIGSSFYSSHSGGVLQTYKVDMSGAKKIYILSCLDEKYDVRMENFRQKCQIVLLRGQAACLGSTVFLQCGYTENDVSPLPIFVDQNYLINNVQFISDRHYSRSVFVANIYFYLNDENNDPYFIDIYNDDSLYALPDIPKRTGCSFEGWYMEKECVNIWSGKYPNSREEVLNLYAKWTINAKMEE